MTKEKSAGPESDYVTTVLTPDMSLCMVQLGEKYSMLRVSRSKLSAYIMQAGIDALRDKGELPPKAVVKKEKVST